MKHCAVFYLLLLLFTSRTFAQAPPVAGLDSSNIAITLAPTYNTFQFRVPNTASGVIDTWRYIVTEPFNSIPLADWTYTTFISQFSYTLTYPFANPITVTQIVTNTAGTDTFA